MRAVVQRVRRAHVTVDGEVSGEIGPGLLVLLGATHGDGEAEVQWMARKLVGLRVFGGDDGRMSRDVRDIGGGMLVVPQFTLYGDVRRGLRPDFGAAAKPGVARPLWERFCEVVAQAGVPVARGVFQAHMEVELLNEGPVTLVIETPASG